MSSPETKPDIILETGNRYYIKDGVIVNMTRDIQERLNVVPLTSVDQYSIDHVPAKTFNQQFASMASVGMVLTIREGKPMYGQIVAQSSNGAWYPYTPILNGGGVVIKGN